MRRNKLPEDPSILPLGEDRRQQILEQVTAFLNQQPPAAVAGNAPGQEAFDEGISPPDLAPGLGLPSAPLPPSPVPPSSCSASPSREKPDSDDDDVVGGYPEESSVGVSSAPSLPTAAEDLKERALVQSRARALAEQEVEALEKKEPPGEGDGLVTLLFRGLWAGLSFSLSLAWKVFVAHPLASTTLGLGLAFGGFWVYQRFLAPAFYPPCRRSRIGRPFDGRRRPVWS